MEVEEPVQINKPSTPMIIPQTQGVEAIYQSFITPLTAESKDKMADILKTVEAILESQYSREVKHSLLILIKQNYSALVPLMKKSFSKKEQSKVHGLLIDSQLQ